MIEPNPTAILRCIEVTKTIMSKKILLDTDIGDDIDDAFALALLTRLEGAETVGKIGRASCRERVY